MPGIAKAIWRPSLFANLVLWLDADQVAGNDGDAIGTWANMAPTGSGNDATQGTGGNKPLLKKAGNGINGHNVLRFDGSDDFMSGTMSAPSTTGYTYFFVAKTGAALNTYAVVISTDDRAGGADWALAIGNGADGFQLGWYGANATLGFGNFAPSTNTVYRGTAKYDKANWNLSGWATVTKADTTIPTTNPVKYHVGTWFFGGANASGQNQLKGDIAEVLVYSVALADGPIAAVEQYLKTKYGL